MKLPARILLAAATLVAASSAHAAVETWNSTVGGDWNSTLWTGTNATPLTGDSLIFGGTTAQSLTNTLTNSTFNIAGITFDNTGAYTIGGNTFRLTGGITTTAASGTQTINNDIVLSATQTVSTSAGTTVALGGAISGATFGITKSGTGTLTLSGANAYTGTTTLSAGTLKAGVTSVANTSGAFGNGSAIVVNGGTLDLNGFNTQIGRLTAVAAGGTVAVGGSALTIGRSTVNLTAMTYAGAFTGTGAGIINFVGNNGTAFATANNNMVTLSGTNTGFTGQINLSGARVFVGTQAAAASAATLAGSSATYNVGANGQVGFLNAVTYNNNVVINGNGWQETLGNTLGALRLHTGAILAGNVTLNAAATIGGSSTGTISGVIADGIGTNSVTIVGDGNNNITFSGANTYAGNTTVNTGRLVLSNSLALQNSALNTASAGKVTVSGTTLTLGGLTGSVALATVIDTGLSGITSLTLNPLAGSQTYSGVIANGTLSRTLTKTGAGTQVLNGDNTYSGGTIVSNGTLTAGSSTAFGSGAVAVNGGTLALGSNAVANAISVASGARLSATNFALTNTTLADGAGLTGSFVSLNAGTVAAKVYDTTGGASFGTLSGQGTFTGGTVTVTGAHNPGNSPGTQNFVNLSYTSGTTVTLEIAAQSLLSDKIIVSGNLDAAGATLNFAFDGSVDYANGFWDTNHTYDLITIGGTKTGEFVLGDTGIFSGGGAEGSWLLSNTAAGVTANWTATAVPEPSEYGLIGAGTLAAVAFVRRRRKLAGKAA